MGKAIIIIYLLLITLSVTAQTGPSAILPEDLNGWRRSGEPLRIDEKKLASIDGEDKNLIIEFGLRYVLTAEYYNFSGNRIDVRIYTMDNSFGSCGLFLRAGRGMKTGKEYGNSSYEKEGEYGFWKHLYFVRMTSENAGDSVSAGFRKIAAFIHSRIKPSGILPSVLRYAGGKTGSTALFRGPLALAEIYYFSPLNIFFINEGVTITNKGTTEIFFRYSDNNEAVRRYVDVSSLLSGMTKFTDFIMVSDFSFVMKDREGKTLVFSVADSCLHVVIK